MQISHYRKIYDIKVQDERITKHTPEYFPERKRKQTKQSDRNMLLLFLTNLYKLWNLGWSDYKLGYTIKIIFDTNIYINLEVQIFD